MADLRSTGHLIHRAAADVSHDYISYILPFFFNLLFYRFFNFSKLIETIFNIKLTKLIHIIKKSYLPCRWTKSSVFEIIWFLCNYSTYSGNIRNIKFYWFRLFSGNNFGAYYYQQLDILLPVLILRGNIFFIWGLPCETLWIRYSVKLKIFVKCCNFLSVNVRF